MSVSLRQEFVSEFKAFYKLDKKNKKSSLKQPDDASIDSNSIIKGAVGGEKENSNSTNNNMMNKIESSSSPTKSIEYFNNPPGRQKLTMETGGRWTMASNRGPNAILSPAAVTTAAQTTSSDDNSSIKNNDNVSIRSSRSNGNRCSRSSSQDETLWKEFKHEFAAYYMKKPAIVLSLDDSYEIEQEQEEKKEEEKESIPRELSFEERYSKMYKLHTQNTGVDVAQHQQQVVGVGSVQEEEEEEVEGDDPALLLQ
jgi:hypothetical protein